MKQNKGVFLVFLVALSSFILLHNACSGKTQIKNEGIKTDTISSKESMPKDMTKKEVKKLTFHDYLSDEQYEFVRWAPRRDNSMDYNLVCEIDLSRGNVVQYWYHEQCLYEYFIYPTSDTTIDIEYTFKADCMLNLDYLEKSNGVKKYPKLRNQFATYHLVNDTTIQVEYVFPEWVKKVNKIAKDSIYPMFYYR